MRAITIGDFLQILTSAAVDLQEKDDMLKYVMEEIDRVKGLFEDKERHLAAERDDAIRATDEASARAAAAEQSVQAARAEAAAALSRAAEAETRLGTMPQQLEVCHP